MGPYGLYGPNIASEAYLGWAGLAHMGPYGLGQARMGLAHMGYMGPGGPNIASEAYLGWAGLGHMGYMGPYGLGGPRALNTPF